ncbi:carbohydrate ABC transporter permease [Microbacterium sp.]|uniref:carbohydrate ABC transporter permease n=1 Tax=Microbacterium sp. TaxID=51671 RepID=UPI0039E414F6
MSTTAFDTAKDLVELESATGGRKRTRTPRVKEPAFRRAGSSDFTKPTLGGLVLRYVLLAFMTLIVIGPLVWQLSTSFKGVGDDIYSFPPNLIPTDPTIQNYIKVTDYIPVYLYAFHSLLVAVGTVVSNAVLSIFAGYALGCMKFKGKFIVLGILLSTMLFPGEVTVTSQFLTIKNLGLADSLWGVFLPGAIGAMNVLLIATACRTIPPDMLDAATIDGATTWQRIRHMVWPNIKGMVSVVAIFSFIGAWDDYLWPLIVLSDPAKYTLTVGMAYLNGTFSADPRLIAAGTMIALIPLVLLFSFTQRFFFEGVQEGAVKG